MIRAAQLLRHLAHLPHRDVATGEEEGLSDQSYHSPRSRLHGLLLATFATEDNQEDRDKEGGHADNILASHALTEHSDSNQARNDRLKTAHDSHRRHIKVVKTTEGDIDGNATLKAAED